MFNQEILDKILENYGTLKSIEICEAISLMYNIKHINCCPGDSGCVSENDYQRDWWADASVNLKNQYLCLQKNS